ncbi:MAG: hypothetical protein WDM79_13375 [Terricaulis sp.]
MVLRLALLAALIVAMAPTLAHLAANAAHGAGLSPLAGPYVAPRPGRAKTHRAAGMIERILAGAATGSRLR